MGVLESSTDALAASNGSQVGYSSKNTDSESTVSSEVEPRGTWGGKIEFLLSCVGYAVGLGNVWRFPYLAYRNGGGAFLIPYLIMLLICGVPLFFMELAFGQFASLGPITMWRAVPLFKGVGWGMIVVSFMVGIYYNVIISWTLYYFFASMTSQLPWELCNEWWNTALCANIRGKTENSNETILHNFTGPSNINSYLKTGLNSSYTDDHWITNISHIGSQMADYGVQCLSKMVEGESGVEEMTSECNISQYPISDLWHFNVKLVSPSEEYWDRRVLRRSESINETGSVQWDLALCLLLAWIVIFLCLIKGVKSSGKVVYFTATFPYIVLTILLIRGCLLEGASDGIKFYVTPQWDRLSDAKVWKDAATQIFYSLGVGFGGLQVMSSYNKFNNNCLLDAVSVSFINCCTSVYAGFAIFSVIGFVAYRTGVDVQDAATSGPGLAFVAYPEGISQMPVAPLWAILFFFMLFTLGLDSQFAMMEAVISGLVDEFPVLASGSFRFAKYKYAKIPKKICFTGGLCLFMFIVGLPMSTNAGVYWFQLLDWYSASHCLLVIVFFELVGLVYVYGWRQFISDIELMVGQKSLGYWMYFIVCWLVLSPAGILFILVFASYDYEAVSYNGVEYPAWAESLGWLVALSSMLMIPLWACVVYCQKSNHFEYIKMGITSEPNWGPALEENRENTKYETKPDSEMVHMPSNGNGAANVDNTHL
ncbi:sodium- and chloride-dependent glycine transporter 1-like isoform X2 [Watersipora subatra]|uniref:sodium- and chloride-dependent glycine transporter 1-like isoform X2 n=1 Tax=Watersipora subatra TaxID=2589382 RepID=UPI00355ADEF5